MLRRRLLISISAICLIGLAALYTLQQYSTEMVHAIVVNALVQKAPQGYPIDKIGKAFDAQIAEARRTGSTEEYLNRLKTISHRIERMEVMEARQIDEILESLNP